jgi:hypothetical protein
MSRVPEREAGAAGGCGVGRRGQRHTTTRAMRGSAARTLTEDASEILTTNLRARAWGRAQGRPSHA